MFNRKKREIERLNDALAKKRTEFMKATEQSTFYKKRSEALRLELAQMKTALVKMTRERDYYKKLAAVQTDADTVKPVVAKLTAHLTGDGDDLDDVMICQEGDLTKVLVLISCLLVNLAQNSDNGKSYLQAVIDNAWDIIQKG